MNRSYPKQLADLVKSYFKINHLKSPSYSILKELFEIMYFASMKSEEQRSIKCSICYLSSKKPDPSPPRRIVNERWNVFRFKKSLPFSIENLIKLSSAADPFYSSLAVFPKKNDKLYIWGMIDQEIHFRKYASSESEVGPERPGLFESEIKGFGNLSVSRDYQLIADLSNGVLVDKYHDVFWKGPISDLIKSYSLDFSSEIEKSTQKQLIGRKDFWPEYIKGSWKRALVRILLSIKKYNHGGAILITPDNRAKRLEIKYNLLYDRLRIALRKQMREKILKTDLQDFIYEKYYKDFRNSSVPTSLYNREQIHDFTLEEIENEVTGCIRFISALSQVDGLILFDKNLNMIGFGAEIIEKKAPQKIYIAGDDFGNAKTLKLGDYFKFGTRHRSMIRYCNAINGSIGFVVSSDGDVRVISKIGKRLLVWENVKLKEV